MSTVNGVGTSRHFTPEEEETLRRDESTSAIVKRDAKTSVDISGTDRSWRATKEAQQRHFGWAGVIEGGHAAFEGAEIAGAIHLQGAAAQAGVIGGAVVGLALGLHGLHEAHVKGEELARARSRDDAHVALIAVLDLPEGYKASRFEGEYKGVGREAGTPAFKMAEGLSADRKGLATLQLHADRGMNAARELMKSGMTVEAFLAVQPKVAEQYRRDAAFREGFDAYLYARANLPAAEWKAMEAKLAERNAWYLQAQVIHMG